MEIDNQTLFRLTHHGRGGGGGGALLVGCGLAVGCTGAPVACGAGAPVACGAGAPVACGGGGTFVVCGAGGFCCPLGVKFGSGVPFGSLGLAGGCG
jgi:hypothetical protein